MRGLFQTLHRRYESLFHLRGTYCIPSAVHENVLSRLLQSLQHASATAEFDQEGKELVFFYASPYPALYANMMRRCWGSPLRRVDRCRISFRRIPGEKHFMEVHYHASLESMKRVVHLVVVAMLLSSACLLTFPWILPPLEPATFAFSEITYQVSFYAACSFLLNLFLGSLAFIPLAFGRYLFEGKLRSIILTPPPRESFQQHR